MLWLYLLAVVLLGVVVAALLGRWEGAAVPGEESDLASPDVDDLLQRRAGEPITAADLQEVRLDSALRGYRMDQVDRLLDALGEQLQTLEQAQEQQPDGDSTAVADPQDARPKKLVEHDIDPRDSAPDRPDKDLSAPSQTEEGTGFPRVE